MRADVLTVWTTHGNETGESENIGQLALEYLGRFGVQDVTGQPLVPTDPNVVIMRIVCDSATLDEIDANPDYHVMHSDNRPAGAIPDAAEFGLLRAYLARQKVSQATIREWIGTGAQGRTRAEIAAILREHLHDLPKAGD